jgi:hypothetical protein
MPFEQGRKKTGGRIPQTPNKRTGQLVELLEEHGYSPVAELIEWAAMARDEYEQADSQTRPQWARIGVQNALGILPYLYPKRKAQEGVAEITPEQAANMTTDELIAEAEKQIQSFKGVRQ